MIEEPFPEHADIDVHDIERNGSWYGKWIGAVRPQLKWTLEMIKTKLDK